MYGFAVHFFNTQNVPLVLSVSYGWTENDQCDADGGEVRVDDALLSQGAS